MDDGQQAANQVSQADRAADRRLCGITRLETYLDTMGGKEWKRKIIKYSASHYDEDGIPVEEDSYNEYGDYCLYRPNSAEEQPIYGLPVHYTVNAFPKGQYIEPLNAVYEQFWKRG